MTDRFDEMAREHNARKMGCITEAEYAAFGRAQHKAGQEAMREKAKEYVEGLYAGQPEPIASAGLRFTIMCGIDALPIEDTP